MDIRAENGALTPVLRTARLCLRPVVLADAAAIVAGVNDWDVAKWLAQVPHPYTPDDARQFITQIVPKAGPIWAIDDGDMVGIISAGNELGYWLAQDRWGRGYMTEAGRTVVDHHFAHPMAEALYSGYFVANERSGGVLTKLGFAPGPLRRMYCLSRGEDVDSQTMTLTRAAWSAHRG